MFQAEKIGQSHMSHAMLLANVNGVSGSVGNRLCAGSFGLFSSVDRKLSYRILSTYIFLNFSHHPESNDMRQPHVLINGLGVR